MTHPPERDWMIVAPWWHWRTAGSPGGAVAPDPAAGRLSRPVFQKYDSPNLTNDFLKNPQRSLRYVREDLVHSLQAASGPSASLAGRLFRLGARRSGANIIDQTYAPDGTDTRKIFLNTHKRFYLVVCSIHCDGPGFPKAARSKVCQAGFVVRRRALKTEASCLNEIKPTIKTLAVTRARLSQVTQLAQIEQVAMAGGGASFANPKLESLVRTRGSLLALLEQERERFEDWVTKYKVVPQLHGWFPSAQGFDKVGCWNTVAEMPDAIAREASFPLYPLIPDENDRAHAGHFGTIYFGLLPTASHDTDERGVARFDDREFYEVRCWARRHKVAHDADRPCPCPDRTFWSLPTRPYKLASHFDLDGTSHQPVTIQLPDLNELAAQAKPTLGVGLAKPPGSLMISGTEEGKPSSPGRSSSFEICFFPIPLITIVATFVFHLFLPVIMLIFQLWWMLALKFCIPPEISLDASISAEIGISGGIEIDADLSVTAGVEANIEAAISADLTAQVGAAGAADLLAGYSPIAVANAQIEADAAAKVTSPAGGISIVADLDYEAEVVHA
jgi:hypothetical protein